MWCQRELVSVRGLAAVASSAFAEGRHGRSRLRDVELGRLRLWECGIEIEAEVEVRREGCGSLIRCLKLLRV